LLITDILDIDQTTLPDVIPQVAGFFFNPKNKNFFLT